MNCANHSDVPVAAYCQNCGRPLCTQCVRSVAGVVYCEPCLAARLHPTAQAASATSGWAPVGSAVPAAGMPGAGLPQASGPSPVLAGFLGLIPGVGAMYNGQFVKAFAHVLIFVVLVSIADHANAFGILVAAWFFYQVFDAVQTAIARRDGLPLPDPLGLNDFGNRLGIGHSTPVYPPPPAQPYTAPAAYPSPPPSSGTSVSAPTEPMPHRESPEYASWAARAAAEQASLRDNGPLGGAVTGEYQPIAPAQPPATPGPLPAPYTGGRPEPVGAIVLIGVGILFLLSTLGVFRLDWIGRGWPVLIIAIGAWLLFRRARAVPPAGGGL